MSFTAYTTSSTLLILSYLDNINSVEDVSVIADYLADNLSDYSPGEQMMLERLIFMYAEIYTA